MAKKTSPYTYAVPIGIAVVAAGVIFFFSGDANAKTLPIGEPDPTKDPPQPAPKKPSGGGGGGPAKTNPPVKFPFGKDEAKILEIGVATTQHGEWLKTLHPIMIANGEAIPSNPSEESVQEAKEQLGISGSVASWLADRAYYEMYDTGKIPPANQRKSGWKPYVESWSRIFDFLKTMPQS